MWVAVGSSGKSTNTEITEMPEEEKVSDAMRDRATELYRLSWSPRMTTHSLIMRKMSWESGVKP